MRDAHASMGTSFPCVPQCEGDLGQRLEHAVGRCFAEGVSRVVVIGTDCPGLDEHGLTAAFRALDRTDVVVGPVSDGGYYLIGLRTWAPTVFRNIAWGSSRVLGQTLERLGAGRLSVHVLPTLSDIDDAEDLKTWLRRPRQTARQGVSGTVSVIIPTINEEKLLPSAIASAAIAEEVEIIVADGGSNDRTVTVADELGVKVVHAPPGRARQMNAGAAIASGDLLLFLHGDTLLPSGYDEEMRRVLSVPGVLAGAFRLRICGDRSVYRLIERAVNLRSRWLSQPYGDQGVFMKSRTFHDAGGFPLLPVMEDFALVRRLRRHGRIGLSQLAVDTSGRRWAAQGPVRTTLRNQVAIAGFMLGLKPDRVARILRREGNPVGLCRAPSTDGHDHTRLGPPILSVDREFDRSTDGAGSGPRARLDADSCPESMNRVPRPHDGEVHALRARS